MCGHHKNPYYFVPNAPQKKTSYIHRCMLYKCEPKKEKNERRMTIIIRITKSAAVCSFFISFFVPLCRRSSSSLSRRVLLVLYSICLFFFLLLCCSFVRLLFFRLIHSSLFDNVSFGYIYIYSSYNFISYYVI